MTGPTYVLSPQDQRCPRWHIPLHLIYNVDIPDATDFVIKLKQPIILTLVRDYPILLQDLVPDPTSGDLRFEARKSGSEEEMKLCTIREWREISLSNLAESNFGPASIPMEFSPDVLRKTTFAAQLNVLEDGLVVSFLVHHCVTDARGVGGLVKKIMQRARWLREPVDPAIHDRSPFFLKPDDTSLQHNQQNTVAISSAPQRALLSNDSGHVFTCTREGLSDLRARYELVLENSALPNDLKDVGVRLSTNDLIAALLWTRLARARRDAASSNSVVAGILTMAIDTRHRLEPSLPASYFGNAGVPRQAVIDPVALLSEDDDYALVATAFAIRRTVDDADAQSVRASLLYPEPNAIQMFLTADVGMSSWGRIFPGGMEDTDFGSGPAFKVRGPPARYDGACYVFPKMPDGSIDVQVGLTMEHAARLGSDPYWQSFVKA